MIIQSNTEMLLFRFSNYKGYDFIKEHKKTLYDAGFVWMLKIGKRSSLEKLMYIKECGGWLILRSPKADGGRIYLARFTEISEKEPEDMCFPPYYSDILAGTDDDNLMFLSMPTLQWFKLTYLQPLETENAQSLVVSKTGKKINDVISTTRTAVMFIRNEAPIEVREVDV